MLFFTTPSIKPSRTAYILFWIAMEVAADFKPFRIIYYQLMEMTMSFAVQLSAAILLGTKEAVWIVAVSTIITEVISRKPWDRVFFNAGQYGLSLFCASYIFHLLKLSPSGVSLDIISDLPAIIISVSVYYLLNTFFISAVISLTSGSKFIHIFMSDFKMIAGYFFSLAPISIAVSLLYRENRPYTILIMIPPLLMADQALRRYYSLNTETQETLKVLANTIDERDRYTYYHSKNVSEYSRKIAARLGLSIDEVNEIEVAGQVHDLGKVGIADNILFKDGPLDADEYNQIKLHPEIAYRLIKNLRPYKRGAEYVLYHHEHYNGTGYPKGISGEKIPLGARIIAVADSFDAMTTDRPYRKALPLAEALEELTRCSGTQFDPEIVKVFLQVLKSDNSEREQEKCS